MPQGTGMGMANVEGLGVAAPAAVRPEIGFEAHLDDIDECQALRRPNDGRSDLLHAVVGSTPVAVRVHFHSERLPALPEYTEAELLDPDIRDSQGAAHVK